MLQGDQTMSTLDMLRQVRIEDLQTKIHHLQNKMAPFVVARRTDEDDYLQSWEAVATMETEVQELKGERYEERTSILSPRA